LPPSPVIATINVIRLLPSNVPECPQMTQVNMWRQILSELNYISSNEFIASVMTATDEEGSGIKMKVNIFCHVYNYENGQEEYDEI